MSYICKPKAVNTTPHSSHLLTIKCLSNFQNVMYVHPAVLLRFSVHDLCMCGTGMWGWAGHSHESAVVQAIDRHRLVAVKLTSQSISV